MIPKTMRAVVLTGHGGPEKLQFRDDVPVPDVGPGQVLVRVHAAGVNNTDINTRVGWYSSDVISATADVAGTVDVGGWDGALQFPRIQGGDLCGTIVAVGDGVSWSAGTRVTSQINIPRPTEDNKVSFIALGSEIDGAFAQYCLLEATEIFDVSISPLSDVEVAAMPCAYGTAWNLLMRSGVTFGDRVLVTGASGGVGLAAVQLAVYLGAVVTGQASSTKADVVRKMGASDVISRGETPHIELYDAVIDVVGGQLWPDIIRAIKPGGHYAVSGAIAGPIVKADLRELYLRDITLHGCSFSPRNVFAKFVDLLNLGTIRPLISRVYSLDSIGRAQEDFMSKTLPGKLVLIP